MELGNGIWALGDESWGRVRAFLVVEEDGLTLIDTLGDEHPFTILAAIRRIGCSISDLRRIWLTHAHFSHLAGLAALKELTGATVGSHRWEADIIAGERKAQRVPILPRRPLKAYYPFQFGLAFGLSKGDHNPCKVDRFLTDRYRSKGGRLNVLHIPGHTPGHLAFWTEEEDGGRVLLSGDAIVTWPYFAGGWDSFTLNKRQQRESLRKMARLAPNAVGVGHGEPITENAAERVKSLVY
jgi:glyoxylase-like metal-dependent hydrolase (beta-lactamase superfamily II)